MLKFSVEKVCIRLILVKMVYTVYRIHNQFPIHYGYSVDMYRSIWILIYIVYGFV